MQKWHQQAKCIWFVWTPLTPLYKTHKCFIAVSSQNFKAAKKQISREAWKLLQSSSERAQRSPKHVFPTCDELPFQKYIEIPFPFLLFQIPAVKVSEPLEDFYITMKETDESDFVATSFCTIHQGLDQILENAGGCFLHH